MSFITYFKNIITNVNILKMNILFESYLQFLGIVYNFNYINIFKHQFKS